MTFCKQIASKMTGGWKSIVVLVIFLPLSSCLSGQQNMRRIQGEARANKIDSLIERCTLRPHEEKMLFGLMKSDPYRPEHFTESHFAFKCEHNLIFATLANYCHPDTERPNLFYLDGIDGGTTRFLRDHGMQTSQLFSANLYTATVEALRAAPSNLENIYHGKAQEALASGGCFGDVQFAALYLDGCGGSTAPIIAMIEAALDAQTHQRRKQQQKQQQQRASSVTHSHAGQQQTSQRSARATPPPPPPPPPPLPPLPSLPKLAIGFTLTLAEPTGRALSDREQDVVRALVAAARRAGYGERRYVHHNNNHNNNINNNNNNDDDDDDDDDGAYCSSSSCSGSGSSTGGGGVVVRHVGDDPSRYGVSPSTGKREGSTLTTWLILGDDE
eukprot:CAMPEP_0174964042 /NCGR_PEP_ID=MMETSP0004_2-20121128/5661_1 /TAXON_ID=420556 /ORGANISM="Ochromonas sp., Strain CCMP1393" /LENGTH=385 /DNA_ID=CAMNT_0016212725 /DNA_START=68 /DNA_END=1225 /DNA_ORIENTATION=-